jgi:putative ABC transport system substrate-binding protein
VKRREFITLLGGAAVTRPRAARAQQSERVWRIGYLVFATASTHARNCQAFRAGLRNLGYVEGKDVVIDFRFADGNNEQLPELAAELVRLKPDVIVTYRPAVPAAKRATSTIPIVMATYGDAVATGLIASLANPGGNLTGLTFFNPELMVKRLELLKEIVPSTTQAGVLLHPDSMANASILEALEVAAKTLRVRLQPFYARGPSEFESAFAMMANNQIGAIVIHDHPLFINNAKMISALAATYRLPSSGFLELPAGGGLMAYGVNFPDMFRRAAIFVDKIVKGSKPRDLPVERSTKFELVINLTTAKALGLDIPPSMLARADEVIE